MFCPKCGSKQEDDSRVCPICGSDLSEYLDSSVAVETKHAVAVGNGSNRKEKNNIIITGVIIQSLALGVYGFLACVLHSRMEQYDLYSISQVGGPMHTMYRISTLIGIALIVYGIVISIKNKNSIKKYEIIVPTIAMIIAFINSGANKVYTATSGGTLPGFLGYGLNVGRNGYDPVDEFYYSSTAFIQYAVVGIVGLVLAAITLTKIRGMGSK